MIKKDLVTAAKKGYPSADRMVNNIFRAMNIAFLKGEEIHIRSFGKFWFFKQKQRSVYDFKAKMPRPFGEYNTIKFKPCREIRRRLNK